MAELLDHRPQRLFKQVGRSGDVQSVEVSHSCATHWLVALHA